MLSYILGTVDLEAVRYPVRQGVTPRGHAEPCGKLVPRRDSRMFTEKRAWQSREGDKSRAKRLSQRKHTFVLSYTTYVSRAKGTSRPFAMQRGRGYNDSAIRSERNHSLIVVFLSRRVSPVVCLSPCVWPQSTQTPPSALSESTSHL